MHQQIIGGVVFKSHIVGDTCGHRDCRYACVSDEGIDFLPGTQEEVEQFHRKHSGARGYDKRAETETEYKESVGGKKLVCLGGCTDGESEENCHDVGHRVRSRLCEPGGHAAFTEQISEEEHSEKRKSGGHHKAGQDKTYYGEYNFFGLTDHACRLHLYEPFILSREQSHQRRLDKGYQSHVGVSRHGHCSEQFRIQF